MRQPPSSPLRSALLVLGLLAGIALQAPAHAAGGLGQFTKGSIAPADISGGVIFGKNGEVVQLDAKGKPQHACVMSKAGNGKGSKLPECQTGDQPASRSAAPAEKATGVPCEGYYTIWLNGVPVKIWYPSGCTPPQ